MSLIGIKRKSRIVPAGVDIGKGPEVEFFHKSRKHRVVAGHNWSHLPHPDITANTYSPYRGKMYF